ncbi:MAG: ATP-binding cassette domain-containing protein [Flavonifractor plautii]
MLEVSHVSKKYRGCQQALEDVSLSVGPGEIVGIFGPNGAGKTTLLKCILGLLRYGFGSVTLDGQPITPKNIARLSFATGSILLPRPHCRRAPGLLRRTLPRLPGRPLPDADGLLPPAGKAGPARLLHRTEEPV